MQPMLRPLALATSLLVAALPGLCSPNIVFMMADDLGWNDVGYHGSDIRTPNIDSIAARGMQLDRYYATPLCSPTRAGFLTGRIPLRLGVDRPIEMQGGLPTRERLLPEVLREAGYRTAIAGKWHLGLHHVRYHPHNRGFESAYGHLGPAVDYWTHIFEGGLDWHRDGKALDEDGYSTELIGKEAERVIRGRGDGNPFFLYVAFNAPHTPLQAPEAAVERYGALRNPNRRVYAAVVSEMDRAVGGIIEALDEEGLLPSTLVVFASDNGGAVRMGAENAPLRDGKGGAFEGGIRVPALVWMPDRIEGGGTFSQMMTVTDWLPTLAAAAGIEGGADQATDGIDMWPALAEGATAERTEPYVVGVFGNFAVIDGDWKYVKAVPRRGTEAAEYLFRLDLDPEESNDLAASSPQRLEAMRAQLEAFPRAQTVSPDVTGPGGGAGGPGRRGRAKRKAAGGPPITRAGALAGWKEINRRPWVELASRD